MLPLGHWPDAAMLDNSMTDAAMTDTNADCQWMSQALDLAADGIGTVEPNPAVGCVIVRNGQVIGQGYHQCYGGPHAEVEALRAASDTARGSDVFVTLEPCCHQGKTGPCTQALIAAGVARVAIGCEDPNPKVAGQGIAALRSAGIKVEVGVLREQAQLRIAPFTKLVTTGRPWVIAKWAMTLDGKLASRTGSSQWISSEASRAVVHALRGRVDAILVGRGTVEADNPRLTAWPAGPRTPTRIVVDSQGSLPTESQLIQTLNEAPLLVATSSEAPPANRERLESLGAEVLPLAGNSQAERCLALLDELGRRQMTNLLVEGGSQVLGTLLDQNAIDEVHVFVAPKLIGGSTAPSPIAGTGIASMTDALQLTHVQSEILGPDVHFHGYCSALLAKA